MIIKANSSREKGSRLCNLISKFGIHRFIKFHIFLVSSLPGKQLQESREARKRTREEITWGFLEGVDLRRIEEGGGCDFFVLRFLMERLHIPLKLKNFYLSAQDNILVNLESEMEYDLLFWRYGDVNLKLEKYYKLCDHENCLHMLVYYRFYAMLSIWRESGGKDETRKIWNFIKRWMPNFEIRFSPPRPPTTHTILPLPHNDEQIASP